ncbi:carbohydrate kinase [Mumia sp. zg.B53]|uniref:carbohydrate kinase family protein n=1 Tax=Mumia sp. zg.B53 TaxID=2855449 RepID=UPI001C6E1BD8|nr:carbohydrate kinase [Mumia sp. zg.B53]MBW9215423.1 carbohydrate kinase [Mumia sp. zg.B53]
MPAVTDRTLVVGEALVDLTRDSGGHESAHPGGSPLNVAVGLARLGLPTVLAAQVGDDEYGELLRDHVDASDVDLRSLPPHHGDSAVAVAQLDDHGVATYHFELTWDPSEMPGPAGFALLHVGSIGAALRPGADAVERLVEEAVAAGVPVSYDPNVRPAITPDLADVRERVDRIVPRAAFVKLSDADAAKLRPDLDPAAYAARIAGEGPRLVALTRGGDGATLFSGGASVEVAPPPITVADTIGAGDSFMAALLAGILVRGWTERPAFDEEALTWLGELAVHASAVTCSRPGADPPHLKELPELLA